MAATMTNEMVFQRKVQKKLLEKLDVNNDSSITDDTKKDDDSKEKKTSPFSLQNIVIVMFTIAVLYFAEFVEVFLYNQNVNRFWFTIGMICVSVFIAILIFLAFYCSGIKKINPDDWEKMYPSAIPVATFCIIAGLISLIIAHWPVYGIMSPVIFGSVFLALVIVIAMFG